MLRYLFFCVVTVLSATHVGAQDDFTSNAKRYIDQYASLAMYEQRKNGIPAAVTLGQGILETEAGTSELMTEANNHFGIKCKNGWQGETFTHTDDAPNECFKKYKCAADSYRDHSEHLKRNPRYSPLFTLNKTDYHGWAVCLKKCGYATNPQYAQRLTKIIEDFNLQKYTFSAFDTILTNTDEDITLHRAPFADTSKKTAPAVVTPQPNAAYVKNRGDSLQHDKHVVKEGETMAFIARTEGMEMKKLMSLNLLNPNEEPLAGSVLELVEQAKHKPSYRINSMAAHNGNAIVTDDEKKPGGDYITIDKTKSKPATDVAAKPAATIAKAPASNNPAPPNAGTATKTIAPENIIVINDSKRPVPPPPPKTEEQLATEKQDKELASLKADLDKIVYADDSKLIAQNTTSPAAPEKKTATETAAVKTGKYYMVKRGDTAFSIAKKNNITIAQLRQWNSLDGDDVKIGQTLQVKE